jgi:hypothetical protein
MFYPDMYELLFAKSLEDELLFKYLELTKLLLLFISLDALRMDRLEL